MIRVALQMLLGDRAKFTGIIIGLAFASLLITQQGAIFCGILSRTLGVINDAGLAEIWVMDPRVQMVDDAPALKETQLQRVRGLPGVLSAMPLYQGEISAHLRDGTVQTCAVRGIDDLSLSAGPPEMLHGHLQDLSVSDGVIVDVIGAQGKLSLPGADHLRRPLAIGDELELNEHRAVVVGICRVGRSFQSLPVIYTTYSRALAYAPLQRHMLSYILVTARAGVEAGELCHTIRAATGLASYTRRQFSIMTARYFMEQTGILINFAIGVGLGILVGASIAGQAFFAFALDNRRHFAVLKAMGAGAPSMLAMVLMQACCAGFIGYGIGVGGAGLFGYGCRGSEVAFCMPWQLLVLSAVAVMLICAGAALAAVFTVLRHQPAAVLRA